MTVKVDWKNPEIMARLRELHAQGISTRDIGCVMGMSRNAVIGKLTRLGLTNPTGPRKGKGSKIVLVPPAASPALAPAPVAPRIIAAPRRKLPPSAPTVRIDDFGAGVPIAALGEGICRWPLGDWLSQPPYRYCGRLTRMRVQAKGESVYEVYCPGHAQDALKTRVG